MSFVEAANRILSLQVHSQDFILSGTVIFISYAHSFPPFHQLFFHHQYATEIMTHLVVAHEYRFVMVLVNGYVTSGCFAKKI